MRIGQYEYNVLVDQDQCVKNITIRFEKTFKHTFKIKVSTLLPNFILSKKGYPITEPQVKEVKLRFGN